MSKSGVTNISADNGVYILETAGPEYRITYAMAIDNVYGKFNEETNRWTGDPEFILEYFGSSKVYTNVEDAWDAAIMISESHDYLEDGVCLIKDFKDKDFSSAVNCGK